MNEPRHPEVTVQLTGEDGNIFFIIGRVRKALRRADVAEEEIDAFSREVNETESYAAALAAVMRWVRVR
jgi:hypothetical protein